MHCRLGLAWWDGGGIAVEQLFMRDHAEEHSVLLEIARRVRERPVLVTFNGKALTGRCLRRASRYGTRVIKTPEYAVHLGMLYPARQLWRLKLGSANWASSSGACWGLKCPAGRDAMILTRRRIPGFTFITCGGDLPNRWQGSSATTAGTCGGSQHFRGVSSARLQNPTQLTRAQRALEVYGVSRLLCHTRRAQYRLAPCTGAPLKRIASISGPHRAA